MTVILLPIICSTAQASHDLDRHTYAYERQISGTSSVSSPPQRAFPPPAAPLPPCQTSQSQQVWAGTPGQTTAPRSPAPTLARSPPPQHCVPGVICSDGQNCFQVPISLIFMLKALNLLCQEQAYLSMVPKALKYN